MNKLRPIYDITPMTMLDYPGYLACIIWFSGCALRCSYCYNPHIVLDKQGKYTEEDALFFLDSRKKVLEGIVLSGGECTDYENITDFCRKIKSSDLKIKIDTNGTNPDIIDILLENRIIDYVALDYKAPEYKYTQICGCELFENFSNTLDLLLDSNIHFEVRTTVGHDFMDFEDIKYIVDDLATRGYDDVYYIQKFQDTGFLLGNAKMGIDILKSNLTQLPLKIEIRE